MEQNSRTSSSSSEDDYISMEVDDAAFFHHHHLLHHHHRRHRSSSAKEFEFQSFSSSSDADRSPADELFYMGKLLPLHLPPRLQMVHTILLNQNHRADDGGEELFATPPATTPFQSCNITPSESCHVSAELDPAEYFRDYLTEVKKSTGKSKKSSGIGSKLNWGYFKSLFTKSSGCSSPYSAAAAATSKIRPIPKQCAASRGDSRSDAAPFGQIRYKKCNENINSTTTEADPIDDYRRGGKGGDHRRSFSGAFKRLSKPRTLSHPAPSVTASESCSNSKNYRQILKRCSSSKCSSEMENPIQAAIAHCKRSQQRPLMAMN